jgi:hypothetical protein
MKFKELETAWEITKQVQDSDRQPRAIERHRVCFIIDRFMRDAKGFALMPDEDIDEFIAEWLTAHQF